MKKEYKSYLIIWAILLALFNVIAFVFGALATKSVLTASFWVGYIFVTIGFVGQLLCAKKFLHPIISKNFFITFRLLI